MARVVVIGAGIGGLAAAARLTATGHRVTVLEQASTVGGKLGWLEATTPEGTFRFDTGPSLLTMPQVFEELFEATGDPLEKTLTVTPLAPIAHYRFGGREPGSPAVEYDADDLTDDDGWRRLMHRAGRMWKATSGPFLEAPGPPSLLSLARRSPRDLPVIAPHRSLRDLGRQYLDDPHRRMFLERYATYSGSDPRRAPAVLATVPFAEQTFGGWYVQGGLHGLALALAERAGEVRTDTPVVAIETAGNRVSTVRLADGGRIPADVVVANADATALYRDLLPRPRLVPRGEPSLSGLVLLLGLTGRTPGLRHHTVLFPDRYPEGYDAEFDAVFAGRMPDNPTVYVSAPPDPTVAPAGCEAWFVLVNAPRHGADGQPGCLDWTVPGRAEAAAERVLDLMAERGQDVRSRIVHRTVRTPADLERLTGTPGGAIYGSSGNGARAAFLRPANRSPVPGLFLAGGSAHPGGGLPLVALSGRAVAQLVGPA
jgi:phytoene desaturase